MARIKDLEEITAAALADNDEFVVSKTAENKEKRIKFSQLLSKIFGGKVAGGTAATDITQNNAVQNLTNKTLTSPKINSSVATNATSEDLNKLHLVTATAAEMNATKGITENIQQQLNSKADFSMVQNSALIFREKMITDGNGDMIITEAYIRNALNLPASRRIGEVVSVTVWDMGSGAPYTNITNQLDMRLSPALGGYLDFVHFTCKPKWNVMVAIVCYAVAV